MIFINLLGVRIIKSVSIESFNKFGLASYIIELSRGDFGVKK